MVLYSEIKYSPKPKNKAHELYESDKFSTSQFSQLCCYCLVAESCLSLWDTPLPPMDCGAPGSSVPGISQPRTLE